MLIVSCWISTVSYCTNFWWICWVETCICNITIVLQINWLTKCAGHTEFEIPSLKNNVYINFAIFSKRIQNLGITIFRTTQLWLIFNYKMQVSPSPITGPKSFPRMNWIINILLWESNFPDPTNICWESKTHKTHLWTCFATKNKI